MAFFAFLSWFRPWWKAAETDYETVLARLTTDIASVQTRLVRIRQRERRVSVTLTIYAVVAWIAYAAFVWLATADSRAHMAKHERLRLWAPAGVGLVIIVSLRYVVRWWFRRVAAGEEKHLRSLQTTRRKKVDEIKAATRYDHLRSLVERYDDTAMRRGGSSRNVSQTISKGSQPGQKAAPTGKASSAAGAKAGAAPAKDGLQAQVQAQGRQVADAPPSVSSNDLSNASSAGGQMIMAPPGSDLQPRHDKTFLDRIADKILGVDPGTRSNAAEQRYALICQVCFNHNGLCPKEDWDEVQYICPRCGTFNSRRPSSRPVSSVWGVSNTPGHRHSLSALPSADHSPPTSTHMTSPVQRRKSLEEMHYESDSSSHSSNRAYGSNEYIVRRASASRQDAIKEEEDDREKSGDREVDALAGKGRPNDSIRQRLADARSRNDKEEHMQID